MHAYNTQSTDTNERMHGRNRYFRKPPDFGALARMYAEFSKYVKIDSQVACMCVIYACYISACMHVCVCVCVCVCVRML